MDNVTRPLTPEDEQYIRKMLADREYYGAATGAITTLLAEVESQRVDLLIRGGYAAHWKSELEQRQTEIERLTTDRDNWKKNSNVHLSTALGLTADIGRANVHNRALMAELNQKDSEIERLRTELEDYKHMAQHEAEDTDETSVFCRVCYHFANSKETIEHDPHCRVAPLPLSNDRV